MEKNFALLEPYTCEELRYYSSIEEVLKDIEYKAPESFWIGDVKNRRAYTISEFISKF